MLSRKKTKMPSQASSLKKNGGSSAFRCINCFVLPIPTSESFSLKRKYPAFSLECPKTKVVSVDSQHKNAKKGGEMLPTTIQRRDLSFKIKVTLKLTEKENFETDRLGRRGRFKVVINIFISLKHSDII